MILAKTKCRVRDFRYSYVWFNIKEKDGLLEIGCKRFTKARVRRMLKRRKATTFAVMTLYRMRIQKYRGKEILVLGGYTGDHSMRGEKDLSGADQLYYTTPTGLKNIRAWARGKR